MIFLMNVMVVFIVFVLMCLMFLHDIWVWLKKGKFCASSTKWAAAAVREMGVLIKKVTKFGGKLLGVIAFVIKEGVEDGEISVKVFDLFESKKAAEKSPLNWGDGLMIGGMVVMFLMGVYYPDVEWLLVGGKKPCFGCGRKD